jgi:hypothetical protein
VLLLDNDRLLEGDIERVGDQYRVRRTVGETWVPADRALCLCTTREEAYTCLRRRANLDDPDERLRLARWCHLQGLRTQALAEVTAAVDLRPDHADSRRLLQNLRRSSAINAASVGGKDQGPEARDEPEAPPPDLIAESLCAFRSRVQPVLMNACASCHATGHGGAFKLTRVYDDGGTNRKLVQRNVAAVLAQVNLRVPQGSPLLTKAVSAHDGRMTQAPLKGRQAPAYHILEDWVQETLAANPHLQALSLATAEPKSVPEPLPEKKPEPATFAETVATRPSTPPPTTRAGEPANPAASVARPGERTPAGPATSGPVDPFDPVIFNRQMHPAKEVEAGGPRDLK